MSRRQSQDWHRVSAILTENAPTVGDVSIGTDNGRVRATMRWTVSDGSSATGKGLVEPGSETGSRTTVWLDRQGALKNAPATPGQAMAAGIVFGTFAAGGTCLLVLGGRWAVRARLDRRRDAEWENEWALVGPQWGHRRA